MLTTLNPGESLTAVMSGAATTTNPTSHTKWFADAGAMNTPVASLSGATAVTLVAAPTSGMRTVESVSIYNADSAAVTVTIAKVSSGTSYTIQKVTLAVSDMAVIDSDGLTVTDSNGRVKAGATATAVSLTDGTAIEFGTDSDIVTKFNATDNTVTSGPTTGLWAGCPSFLDPDPNKFTILFEHFLYGPAATTVNGFTSVDDSGTGTNAYQDAAGGIYNIVTAAEDNDYHAMASQNETWKFAAGKKLWFEVRFKLTEAATNESAWWFGLTDTLTTGGFQADAAGPLASYDGALIWKDEATMTIDFETSNAGTQATTTAMATFVSNTWTRVGFYFDGTATTSVITPYYEVTGVAGTAMTAGTAQNITLAGLEEMHLIMGGVKAGPGGGAETLMIDYVKIVQLL